MTYTCDTCGYKTDTKYNYTRHLEQRKNECKNANPQQVQCSGCETTIQVRNYDKHKETCKGVPLAQCRFCPKTFLTRSGKSKHQKKCKEKTQIVTTTEEPSQQQQPPAQCLINNGNMTINITNITLNFGQENVSYLLENQTPEIQRALRSLVDSVDVVHFNKDHPENHTVRKLNKKSNLMEFKTADDRWEHECCRTGIPKLRHNLKEHLKTTFDDNTQITDPDLRELLYHKSLRGLIEEKSIVSKYHSNAAMVDTVAIRCEDECDDIKSEFFRTVSPNIQKMPCVVQDIQRRLNEVRNKYKQTLWDMDIVVDYMFT